MTWMRVLLPLAVLLVTNVWLFGGVWWNRSGAPTGEISFDQCHFGGPGGHYLREEGRYFTLQIASPSVSIDMGEARARRRAQEAVVLIEQGVPAWEAYRTQRTEEGETGTPPKFISRNRLVYADSAEKAAGLKAPDPDVPGHAIMRGYVRSYENGQGESVSYRHASSRRIAIQSEYRALFKEMHKNRYPAGHALPDAACTPQYRITLTFGARFEPWISSVERIGAGG
ncbi:MAG: hypothetical protein CMN55_02805 [Sneathiella sp.]|jgi:hypothetical protein|uniref:DUF4824 family protein n=1 Tax=Sneathiella sp. TaxID=1964365 RepID=UPI000C56EE86|nr:DUF4824 family protein [Sneathiella sp.]MAL78036.1 hypothetical protein [Sneathiella sp.]|tara:strand:+ start:2900 stop:3580 length:681 start_codon:yes stop_codon:yes gene_type:complete